MDVIDSICEAVEPADILRTLAEAVAREDSVRARIPYETELAQFLARFPRERTAHALDVVLGVPGSVWLPGSYDELGAGASLVSLVHEPERYGQGEPVEYRVTGDPFVFAAAYGRAEGEDWSFAPSAPGNVDAPASDVDDTLVNAGADPGRHHKPGRLWSPRMILPAPRLHLPKLNVSTHFVRGDRLGEHGQTLVEDRGGLALAAVHAIWRRRVLAGELLRHPLTALVREWLEPVAAPPRHARVVQVNGMIRQPRPVSLARFAAWVPAVHVDGEPVASPRAAVPASRVFRLRTPTPRQYELLPSGLRLPAEPRLAAVADFPGVLGGDVLTLLGIAHAVRGPVELDETTGARLLARTRTGGYRRPRASDVRRYHRAVDVLRSLMVPDPTRDAWLEFALVEAATPKPCTAYRIGPPPWLATAGSALGRWELTAEGSWAARHRQIQGERGRGGRLISALEYALGAIWHGARGVSPYLRAVRGAGGAGHNLELPLGAIACLMAEQDPAVSGAARKRMDRAVDAVRDSYQVTGGLVAQAPAGDSVELVRRVRGGRGRHPALIVRASARYVEEHRLASRKHGERFQPITLDEWLGIGRS